MGVQDILLRLRGDSSSAVKAANDTTNALKGTESQAYRTGEAIGRMSRTLQQIRLTSLISAIGSIQSAFANMAEFVNALTGGGGREAAADRELALAGTGPEFGAAIAAQARAKALKATPGKIWENILPGRSAGETKVGRRVGELEKLLLDMSPEEAQVALQNVPAEFFEDAPRGYTRGDVAAKISKADRAATYRAGLRGGGGTTNITNIYPTGTNPTSVDKAQSRYERVNGRPRRP